MQYNNVCIYIANVYIHIISARNLFPGVEIMENCYFLDSIVLYFCFHRKHISHFIYKRAHTE